MTRGCVLNVPGTDRIRLIFDSRNYRKGYPPGWFPSRAEITNDRFRHPLRACVVRIANGGFCRQANTNGSRNECIFRVASRCSHATVERSQPALWHGAVGVSNRRTSPVDVSCIRCGRNLKMQTLGLYRHGCSLKPATRYNFHPIKLHSARPITNSRSLPLSHGISSVYIVTHCFQVQGMRVMSVPQNMRSGPKASNICLM